MGRLGRIGLGQRWQRSVQRFLSKEKDIEEKENQQEKEEDNVKGGHGGCRWRGRSLFSVERMFEEEWCGNPEGYCKKGGQPDEELKDAEVKNTFELANIPTFGGYDPVLATKISLLG